MKIIGIIVSVVVLFFVLTAIFIPRRFASVYAGIYTKIFKIFPWMNIYKLDSQGLYEFYRKKFPLVGLLFLIFMIWFLFLQHTR
jgi:hypothetical protein